MPSLLIALRRGPDRRILRFDRLPVVFGRGRDCEVALDDPAVSRRHCELRAAAGALELRDLGSANGTWCGGVRVERVVLHAGDRFLVGANEVEVLGAGLDDAARAGAPPAELRGCRIVEAVGRGGFATVYRARQLALGRDVALKILDPAIAARPGAVQAFLHEARAAAALSHPHLVQVHDVGVENGFTFSIMEFLPGGSLEQRVARDGALPWREAARAARDCARALEYAASRGILHHDVKLGNLLIGAEGQVKLADLGLAGALSDAGRTLSAGSPHSMAPERIRKLPIDARSDLYSLGCTLFRVLTARHVFEVEGVKAILRAHCSTQPPRLAELGIAVPDMLEGLLGRLLRKDPADRPDGAAAVALELERILAMAGDAPAAAAGAAGVLPPPSAARDARDRRRRQTRWRLVLGIACTALLLGFALRGHQVLLAWSSFMRRAVERIQEREPAALPPIEPAIEPAPVAPAPDPPPITLAEPAEAEPEVVPRLPELDRARRREVEAALADYLDPRGDPDLRAAARARALACGADLGRSALSEMAATNWTQAESVARCRELHELLVAVYPGTAARVEQAAGSWREVLVSTIRPSTEADIDRLIVATWHEFLTGVVPAILR